MKIVEILTVEDLIEELMLWHDTFRDAPDNYDAQLLKKTAKILQEQYNTIGKLEDQISEYKIEGSNA